MTLNGSLPVDTATTVRLKVYSPVELSVSFTAETSGGLDISSPENITVDFGTAVVSGNIEMKSGKRLLIGTGNNPSVKEFNMRLQARTVVLGGTLGVVTSNEGTLSVFGGNVHVIADTLDLGISMAYGVSLDVAVYTLNVVNTASFYCKDQNFSDHVSIVATECTGASDPSTISFSGYRVFIHMDTMADGSSTPYFFSNGNGPISPLGNDFDINIGKYASPYALIHCVGNEITHNIRVSIGEDGCTSHVGLFVVGQQYTNAKLTGVINMVPNDLMDYDYTGKGIPAGFYGTYDVIFLNELESSIGNKQDALAFDGTYNATTNKVATVSTVTQAVASLDAPKHVFSGQFTGTVNDLQLDDMLSDGTYTFQLDSTIVSKINTCTNPLIMVTFYAEFWCPFNARPTHDTTSCLLGSMRASTIRGYRVSAPITSINGISSGGDDNFADFGFSIILDNVTNALPLSTFPFEFRNVPSVVVGTRMEWTYSVTIFDK